MTQCNEILKCKLGVSALNQWECVKIRRDCLYVSPFNMYGVVDLHKNKESMIVNRNKGGKVYDEVCCWKGNVSELER